MIDINNMTVLLADDMPNMIQSIKGMLKILGFGKIFLPASNGEEALKVLKKESVDMAIIDYDMPVMTGIECLREIREDRKYRDLPVIMITAQAYQDFVAEVGESEINAYILKPVTIKLLEDKVSTVIEEANNPPPLVYHLKMARQFEEEGNLDEAINQCMLAIRANPKASRAVRELGYYYLKQENMVEAEKWLLKATKMNSMDVFAFHHLGNLYLNQNDIEKASYYFEKAIEISPRHLSRGLQFGKTLVTMKKLNKAIKVFEKTFQLSDDPHPLKEEIADFCISFEAHSYAAKLLESIIDEKPNRDDLFFKLGLSYEKLGDTKKAVSCFVRAENADQNNEEIKLHLAKNYLSLQKPILAEKPLLAILKKNPDHLLARELLNQC